MSTFKDKEDLEYFIFNFIRMLDKENYPKYLVLKDDEYELLLGGDPKILNSGMIETFMGAHGSIVIYSEYQKQVMRHAERIVNEQNHDSERVRNIQSPSD